MLTNTFYLLFIAITIAVVNAASVFTEGGSLADKLEKRITLFTNGFPGLKCNADAYNVLDKNWNRTYTEFEPQQIHISITDEAQNVRVQFVTLSPINHSVLKYWIKSESISSATTIKGEDLAFEDGGSKKRKIYLHNFKTNDLAAASLFSYQVGSATSADDSQIQWSQIYEFHTPSSSSEFSFIAVGDVGACNAISTAHIKNAAKNHKFDFVAHAGDQAYDMEDFSGTKGDEYMNFMQDLFAQTPYVGTPGNHESAYDFSHYKNRFNIVPYAESNSKDAMFYSLNYKSLHLVSWSSEVFFKGSSADIKAALAWLDADLAKANQNRAKRPWIIFMTHRPIYCSSISISADCTINAGVMRNGWLSSGGVEEILAKHKVDLFVSGHVHNYERTYPVFDKKRTATTYNNAPNLFQIVVGNGGNPEGPSSFSALGGNYADWSAVRYKGFGYSTFKVTPNSIDIVHQSTLADGSLGDIVDQFTITKSSVA